MGSDTLGGEPPVGTKALAAKSLPGRRRSELRMAGRISRRAKVGRAIRRAEIGALPDFIPPQLTALTETPPKGGDWGHELKWDGYRMHARIEARNVRLLTRTGLDWTDKYPSIGAGPDFIQCDAGGHGRSQHRRACPGAVRSPLL